jgi:hypothetical protein
MLYTTLTLYTFWKPVTPSANGQLISVSLHTKPVSSNRWSILCCHHTHRDRHRDPDPPSKLGRRKGSLHRQRWEL